MEEKMETPFRDTSPIEINVKYKRLRSGIIKIIKGKREVKGESSLKTLWQRIGAEEIAEYLSHLNAMGKEMDYFSMRAMMVKAGLKSWSLEGVPCTYDNFAKLDASIATELMNRYSDLAFPKCNKKES